MTEVVVFFCPETGSYVPKNKPLLETKVRLESTWAHSCASVSPTE